MATVLKFRVESDVELKPLIVPRDRPDVKTQLGWYRHMHMATIIDDRAKTYIKKAQGWSYHAPVIGHGGIQLALGLTFRQKKDHLFPYYRDLLTCLAGGLTPYEIVLNGLSRRDDVASGGRHMSNHFAKIDLNIWNVSSCTGNHALHGVGLARAIKKYGDDAIVYTSQGESSCSEGYVFEAVNGASREKLPVVFVVQNNGYGISVPVHEQTANPVVSDNFRGFRNLTILNCDGTNPFDSMNAMKKAVEAVRKTGGPVLVHAQCVRYFAHSNSDRQELYREVEELAEARSFYPLARMRKHLLEIERVPEEVLEKLEAENIDELDVACTKAEAAPTPDPATAVDFVLPAEATVPPEAVEPNYTDTDITLREAINETLKEEFRRNPNTFLWGQDVASKEKGGVFLVTKGMQQEFGNERVFNAPIAEDFIVGTANGFSRYRDDIRVVIEAAQFADYLWPAVEQVVELSHDYYRSNGVFAPNVLVRLASGGYIGGGLYHSQNLEAMLMTLPGLRVVVPAFPDDAVGMIRQAMRSPGPTFFLEPKYLYNQTFCKTKHPGPDFVVPFGKARLRREGDDLSIITFGTTVHWSLRAARKLSEDHGIECDVLDLRSIVPMDHEAILATVKKTGRVLVVHEDKVTGGVGGEIAARVADLGFRHLDAPVRRVGSKDCPVPFSRILEDAVLPQEEDVFRAALDLAKF
jgi:2-oxoisovalerate dehydrogenase E1 component